MWHWICAITPRLLSNTKEEHEHVHTHGHGAWTCTVYTHFYIVYAISQQTKWFSCFHMLLSLDLFICLVSRFSLSRSPVVFSIVACVLYIIYNIVPAYNVYIIYVYLKIPPIWTTIWRSHALVHKNRNICRTRCFASICVALWVCMVCSNESEFHLILFFFFSSWKKKVKGLKGCVRDWRGQMNFSCDWIYTLWWSNSFWLQLKLNMAWSSVASYVIAWLCVIYSCVSTHSSHKKI